MGKVLELRTPTGGTSSIEVDKTERGNIELRFRRELGLNERHVQAKSETLVAMSADHARRMALRILELLEA